MQSSASDYLARKREAAAQKGQDQAAALMQNSASGYLEKKRAQQKGQDQAAALMQSSAADYLAKKRSNLGALEA